MATLTTRNNTDFNIKAPVQKFINAQAVFLAKQKQSNASLKREELQEQWKALSAKDRQTYEKEYLKADNQYKEEVHNYEYLRKGQTPPKFELKPPKPSLPQIPYFRWLHENRPTLHDEWKATKPFRVNNTAFLRWGSEKWSTLSAKDTEKYTKPFEEEKKIYEKENAAWREKYAPKVEEKPKKAAPVRSKKVQKKKSEKSQSGKSQSGKSKSGKSNSGKSKSGKSQSGKSQSRKAEDKKEKGKSRGKSSKGEKSKGAKSRGKSSKNDKKQPGKKIKGAKNDKNDAKKNKK